MNKFENIICLVIWILLFVYGIVAAFGAIAISPITFICATVMCILHYIEKLNT